MRTTFSSPEPWYWPANEKWMETGADMFERQIERIRLEQMRAQLAWAQGDES